MNRGHKASKHGDRRHRGEEVPPGQMPRPEPETSSALRIRFFAVLWRELGVVWPILSGIVGLQAILGLLVAHIEGWSFGNGIYFAYITGLTIGYGDFAPSRIVTRCLAVAIGLSGILLTGLIAAVGVRALQMATDDKAE